MVNQLRVLKITLSKLGDNTGAVCLVDIGGLIEALTGAKHDQMHHLTVGILWKPIYLIFESDRSFWIGLFWVSLAPLKIQVFLNSSPPLERNIVRPLDGVALMVFPSTFPQPK